MLELNQVWPLWRFFLRRVLVFWPDCGSLLSLAFSLSCSATWQLHFCIDKFGQGTQGIEGSLRRVCIEHNARSVVVEAEFSGRPTPSGVVFRRANASNLSVVAACLPSRVSRGALLSTVAARIIVRVPESLRKAVRLGSAWIALSQLVLCAGPNQGRVEQDCSLRESSYH